MTATIWDPAPTATAPTAGPLVAFGHAYNKVNQRIGQTVNDNTWLSYPAATPATTAYTANSLNQYTAVGAVTPTYDGAGNTASYAFDAQGRRKSRTVNGTTTISVTDADNREVLEYNGGTGALLRWYAYGLGPNAVLNQMNIAGGTRATLLPGMLGSIIASFDSSSGSLSKFGYQPYGASAAPAGPFGYTGQRFDQESELYYYRARHYSTKWGRFLQPDPVGYSAGLNLYAYVGNNPLNLIDGTDTLQFGFAGSVSIPFLSITVPLGVGIAVDTSLNVGVYAYGGVGFQVGANAEVGLSVQYSNASTIYDLSGRFNNLSVHAGTGIGGSVDYFTGTSPNGPVMGGGATIGAAGGASASIANTTTIVCGARGCAASLSDLVPSQTEIGLPTNPVISAQPTAPVQPSPVPSEGSSQPYFSPMGGRHRHLASTVTNIFAILE